jgi:hypothetical protein
LYALLFQHGERAVRTPFTPVGHMPFVPGPPAAAAVAAGKQQLKEGQQEAHQPADNQDAPKAAAASDSSTMPTTALAAAAAMEQQYPGLSLATPTAVTLVFPEQLCPERLVFVVNQPDQDTWVRDHGANFSLQLRSPCLNDMVEGVLAAEGGYEHWGLLHRLQRVLEVLDNAEAAGD